MLRYVSHVNSVEDQCGSWVWSSAKSVYFSGRINRTICSAASPVRRRRYRYSFAFSFGRDPKTTQASRKCCSTLGLVMGAPLMLIDAWVGMALQTKRFHDRGSQTELWVTAADTCP